MSTTAEQRLYTALAAGSGLTALLAMAGAGGPGIYPVEAPEGAEYDLLTYQIIASTPQTTHGEGTGDARLDFVHVQLTAYAATGLKAQNILYQARLILEASTLLKGIQVGEGSLPRDEDANCHGRYADFQIVNNPDA